MFWALKNLKKQCTGVRNIEFWISHWRVVGLLLVVDVFFLSNVNSFTSQNSNTHALLGHILLKNTLRVDL